MSDPRIGAVFAALVGAEADPQRGALLSTAATAVRSVAAYDANHGIVRVDPSDPATIEAATRGLFEEYYRFADRTLRPRYDEDTSRYFRRLAVAVLAVLAPPTPNEETE